MTVRLFKVVFTIGTLLIVAVILLPSLGLRFVHNVTPSAPRGTYVALERAPHRNEFMEACLPSAGIAQLRDHGFEMPKTLDSPCKESDEPVIKRVVARAGDRFRVDPTGVWINEQRVPDTIPLPGWNTAPARQLRGDEVIGIGIGPQSFDSRYVGPLHPLRTVVHVLPW